MDQPRQSVCGERAAPAAFQLAKQLRQAPKKIATELAAEIGPIPGVASLEVAGNGYINIRLDLAAYGAGLMRPEPPAAESSDEKIIVEHSKINSNKTATIAHMLNATICDTFNSQLQY